VAKIDKCKTKDSMIRFPTALAGWAGKEAHIFAMSQWHWLFTRKGTDVVLVVLRDSNAHRRRA